MKKFITFAAWAIPMLLLAWFAYTLIQNTKPQPQDKTQEICITVNFNNKPVEGTETVETTQQVPAVCPFSGETKTSEVKTVVKTTKSEPSERRVVITEDAFKETMQQVAYTARQEAQNEYDKNFATLLTILTIFGIAWPAIIALLQFKFNERELDKIQLSKKNADSAILLATQANDLSNNTAQKAQHALNELKTFQSETYFEMYTIFEKHGDFCYDLHKDIKNKNHYYSFSLFYLLKSFELDSERIGYSWVEPLLCGIQYDKNTYLNLLTSFRIPLWQAKRLYDNVKNETTEKIFKEICKKFLECGGDKGEVDELCSGEQTK